MTKMSRVHYGTCAHLEDEADRLLHESLEGVFSHKEKSDILTPWKQKARLSREIYSGIDEHEIRDTGIVAGAPEKHIRNGMFNRVTNRSRLDLNSRDGWAAHGRPHRGIPSWEPGATTHDRYPSLTIEAYRRGDHLK